MVELFNKLLFLTFLLLASCSSPTGHQAWTGCYEIHIGNNWTNSSIALTATTFRIAEYRFDDYLEIDNTITATRILKAGSTTSVSEMKLTRTDRGVGGMLITHTFGSDCDSRDTQLVWCKPIPCSPLNPQQ